MALEISTMRAPVTRVDWPDDKDPAEFTLVGNHAKPASLDASNVYPIPLVMKDERDVEEEKFSNLQEVEEIWQLQFRTDNPDSDCLVTVWCWNVWVEQWFPWAALEVKGENGLDIAHGGVWTDNGVLGVSHIGIQVSGHGGSDELYVTHMWR